MMMNMKMMMINIIFIMYSTSKHVHAGKYCLSSLNDIKGKAKKDGTVKKQTMNKAVSCVTILFTVCQ